MTIYDGYEFREVVAIEPDPQFWQDIVIRTACGGTSLAHCIQQYFHYSENTELLNYCKQLYPEYFI